jgi:hypothetical protein
MLLPAGLAIGPAAWAQDPDNPVPPPPVVQLPPPVLNDAPPAASPASSAHAVIKLPPFDVTEPKEHLPSINGTFEKLNHVFDGTFPSLRSGPLIEAILWRHRYLKEHPREDAIIVTTQQGTRVRSATTVYTRDGKVYGSSNALGENLLLKGLAPADLHRPEGLARARKFIAEIRGTSSDALPSTARYSPGGGTDRDAAPLSTGASDDPGSPPASSNAGNGLGDPAAPAPNPKASSTEIEPVPSALSSLLVAAEESGDYSILAAAAGPAQHFAASDYSNATGHTDSQIQGQWDKANYELGQAAIQAFAEPSGEILSWTYQALHDPARAGIVPVALAQVRTKGKVMTISPFDATSSTDPLQPHSIVSAQKSVVKTVEAIVFDWEGVQYLYQPDIGTEAKPLPLNAITGLPYLCVKNGALLECAYFCATYARQHPEEKAVLVPGDPVVAAYQKDGRLGLFIPTLGRFTLPKDYWDAVNDRDSLGQLRDQLVALQRQKGEAPDLIPQEIAGDDADLQMRRAFLACEAAGIPCHLNEAAEPTLDFTWEGAAYIYGSDQQVRPAPDG